MTEHNSVKITQHAWKLTALAAFITIKENYRPTADILCGQPPKAARIKPNL